MPRFSSSSRTAHDGAVTPEALTRLQRFLEEAFESDPAKLSTAHELVKDLVEGLAPGQSATDNVSPEAYARAMDFAKDKLSRDDAAALGTLLGGYMSPKAKMAGDGLAFDAMIDRQVARATEKATEARERNFSGRWPAASAIPASD